MQVNKNIQKFVKSSVSAALVASTIGAVVPEQTASASSFTDLSPANSHYDNITQLLERGVIKGFPDGTYRPNDAVTRGQAAKIIAAFLNLDTKNVKNPGFTDIPEDHQYYGHIAALVQAGVISGYSDQTFKQQNSVTRGQMSKMLARAFQLKASTFENPFTDISPSHEYYSYITALYENQVTQGKTANEFDMKSAVTRGQLASFVIRAENATINSSALEGTIDNISNNTVSINGSTYHVDEQLSFLVNESNAQALLNANIKFTAKNSVITAVDYLALQNNAATFNGYGATIPELVVASSFTTLENIKSDAIHYATTPKKVTLNAVTATNVTIEVADAKTASLTNVSNLTEAFELSVNSSAINNLHVNASSGSIQEIGSTIQNLFANAARLFTLTGQFTNVHINGNAQLLGTARIQMLHWLTNPNNSVVAPTLAIQNATFNSATYSWADAVKQFAISNRNNSGSGSGSSSNSASNSDSDNDSDSEDSSDSNDGSGSEDNASSDNSSGSEDNAGSGNGSGSEDNAGSGNSSGSEDNAGSGNGSGSEDNAGSDNGLGSEGNTGSGNGSDSEDNTGSDNGSGSEGDSNNDLTTADTVDVSFKVSELAINNTLDLLTGQVTLTSNDTGTITTSSDSSVITTASIKVLKANNEIGQSTIFEDGTFAVRLQNIQENDTLIIEVTVNGETKQIEWTVPAQTPAQTAPQQVNNASVRVEDGQLLITTATGEAEQYTVDNNALQQLLADNHAIIENISFDAENNEITAVRSLSLTTNSFDGSLLADLPEQLESLQVAATDDLSLANVTNVAALTVEGNGTVTLQGTVTDTTTIAGNVDTIDGGTSDVLIINSTAAQVTVTNNNAAETIIPDSTKLVQQARVASLTDDFLSVANTTTMEITFTGSSAQVLTIERADVKVNLEGEPFSRINIKNNGVNITAESSNAHLFVSNGVSQLTLDADVEAFTLNLEQPIVISSSTAKTIGTLLIKTTKAAAEVKNWIELINVTPGTIKLNDAAITLADDIFKKQTSATNTFTSTTNYVKFGYYSFNFTETSGAKYYYKLLKGNESVDAHKNLTTSQIQAFTEYTDAMATSGIYIPADVTAIMLYEVNGATVKVSTPAIQQDQYLLYYLTADNSITTVTRFGDSQSPADVLGAIHIFKNGSLATSLATGSSWEKNATVGNEFNTATFNLGFNLNGTREIFVTKSSAGAFGSLLTTHESDYVNALKKLAQIAVETNDTTHFETLLEVVAANKGITYNSFFLSKYVQQINNNPSQITKLADYQTVFNNVNNENAYDRDATLTAAQLYLTDSISSTFTYSVDGIVKNSISDDGKLTFTGLAAGATTLRVQDESGNATLVNVTVDADKNVVINPDVNILKVAVTADTLIEGADSFRSVTVGNQAYLIPTKLTTAAAIIQKDASAADPVGQLSRVILSSSGGTYVLSTEEAITAKTISFSELGLDSLSILASTNVNGWVEGTDLILYPRFNGEESILIGNATKSTAVYVDATTTIDVEIAKSVDTHSIENDLKLRAFVIEKDAGTSNVHVYNNNGEIELFANNAATGHYIFTDNADDNSKTIVNFTASNTGGKVTVDTFDILKADLVGNNTNATITNVSNNIVRYVDNTIFAVRKGTSIVTMSDGTQFEVVVGQSGETYTLKAEKVANYELKASDLHMTDILTINIADDTAQTQLINNNQSLLVRLSGDKTTTFTLTSSIGEKAIVHITKAGNDYEKTIDRSQIALTDLNLNTVTDVIGLPMDIIAARVAFDATNVYIYNLNQGTRSFRATNGTDSTAINVTVNKDADGKFISTPTVITHDVVGTIENNGDVTSNAARLVGNKLYATGLSMTNGEATIEVPLDGGAKYNIKLTQDANTGLYSFADQATIAYSFTVNKADLGLDTITSATVPNANIVAQVDGDNVIVTLNAETDGRVRINGTKGSNTTAASYVHFVRTGTATPTQTIEKLSLQEKLSDYGLISNSSSSATRPEIVRLATKADSSIEVFALEAGTTGYEVKDSTNKVALFNISVTEGAAATDSRTTDAQIVRHEFTTDTNVTATIIEGDAVRLHGNYAYAVKPNASAKVRLSTGTVIQYTVEIDTNGQYVLTPKEQANAKVITAADIGLNGAISATGFDPAVVSTTAYNDTISVLDATTSTDTTEKKTSLTVTDASGSKSLVNVTIAANKEITVSDAVKTTATAPKLIQSADSNIVRIVGDDIYAIGEGTATLLVGNTIQQVTVSKANGHYAISAPQTVSSTILTASDLGFDENANMTIEAGYDTSVAYVGLLKEAGVKDRIIAYSLLNGTTGATEFVVKASDSGLRTLVRVTAGATLTHKIAEQTQTFTSAPTIADTTVARFASDKLYALKEGHTYATVDNRLQTISVSRIDNHLTTTVTELKETIANATFTALAGNETNTAIIDIVGDTIYAKAIGQTKVKNGDQVYIVNVTNANGPLEMNVTPITSQTVSAADMGLGKLIAASIVQTTDAISLSRADDSVTIYSKGTPTAQTLTVKVTDEYSDHAIINVTINEQGEVSAATVAKATYDAMAISATATERTAKARAVWNDKTLTVYALESGKTKFKFDGALVNVNTTANGNLLSTIAITPLAHSLTTVNEITNGAIMNEHYMTGSGTALVNADGKTHSVTVEELTDEYKLTVSNGVPFTEIDITDSTYAVSGAGTIATVDEDETSTLIIYQDGVGTTDITITSGGKTVVHQVKSHTNGLKLNVAKKALADVALPLTDATLLDGTTARLEDDELYYLAEGVSTFKLANNNNRLATVNVTRDADQFFTATEAYVSATLKEVPAPATFSSSNFELDNNTVYALNGETVAAEVFYTTNYRTSLQTVVENGEYKVKLDERKMKAFNFADYGLTGPVTVTEGGNTKPTVAKAETYNNQIIIYAGDVADTTNITLTDGNTTVTFIATVDEQGEIVVTPQAALNSVLFADLDLTTATPITVNNLNNSIMSVAVTDSGLNIIANGTGQGSIEVKQDGATVAIVNVSITQNANNQYKVTATPLTFETEGTSLLSTATARQSTPTSGKYYVTGSGYFFYKNVDNTAYYAKATLGADKVYTLTESTHTLKTVTATELDLDTITSASVSGSIATVDKLINTAADELYIFGLNDGQADVTVKGTKVGAAASAIIVVENGATLEGAIAVKEEAFASTGTWTKVAGYNEIATIRNGKVYAIASGKSVYKDTTGKLANITITRNANMHYDIVSEPVVRDYGKTVTLIDGTSVAVDGSTVYAQQEGLSTIKVDNDYFTATVVKNADGLFKLEVSAEAIVQATFTPVDLGVDTITNATISSITGAGVVTSLIKDGNVIIYAKNTGQAEIRINDDAATATDETETIIHALVTETNGKLVLAPTIAKAELLGADTVQSQGLFRGKDNFLFALGEGHEVAAVNGELYNLTATKVNNALKVAAVRIELTFDSTVSNPTDNTVIKIDATDDKKVIALKAGVSDVTVDGQTYRITVGTDGSIKKDLVQADTVNVSEALPAITEVKSTLTDATFNGTIITLVPKANANGTEIITVENGTNIIQVRVTVTNENGQASVQSEIVKQTFNTASFGFSPLAATLADGTAFTAANGIIKVDNLALTVYPGAPGTSHAVITGNEAQQAIYTLNVDASYNATFTPFTQTVSYNDIQFLPNVLASTGTAKAIGNDAGGFNVQFRDFNEAIFVVQGDNASYKTITVKATHTNNIVSVEPATVKDAHVVAGTVTAASDNLKMVEHNGNTVIYTDKNTPATGFYTVNGVMYNVAITADYTINATRVDQDAASYTNATHLYGDDVVAIITEGAANKWLAKAVGTGIYKVGTDYVEVTVAKDANQEFEIKVRGTLAKGLLNDTTLTNITVIEPASGVYADNDTIFDTRIDPDTSKVVVKAMKDGKAVLYTGTVSGNEIRFTQHNKSIKAELNWTGYKSHDLNTASTVARIDGDTLYATGVGTETITFTSENGVSQSLTITVANDFTVTVTPTNKNVITYSTSNDEGLDLVTYTLTFDLSINPDMNIELDAATVGTVFIDETINKITIVQPTGTQKVYGFTITLPELNDPNLPFEIVLNNTAEYYIQTQTNSKLQFKKTN